MKHAFPIHTIAVMFACVSVCGEGSTTHYVVWSGVEVIILMPQSPEITGMAMHSGTYTAFARRMGHSRRGIQTTDREVSHSGKRLRGVILQVVTETVGEVHGF